MSVATSTGTQSPLSKQSAIASYSCQTGDKVLAVAFSNTNNNNSSSSSIVIATKQQGVKIYSGLSREQQQQEEGEEENFFSPTNNKNNNVKTLLSNTHQCHLLQFSPDDSTLACVCEHQVFLVDPEKDNKKKQLFVGHRVFNMSSLIIGFCFRPLMTVANQVQERILGVSTASSTSAKNYNDNNKNKLLFVCATCSEFIIYDSSESQKKVGVGLIYPFHVHIDGIITAISWSCFSVSSSSSSSSSDNNNHRLGSRKQQQPEDFIAIGSSKGVIRFFSPELLCDEENVEQLQHQQRGLGGGHTNWGSSADFFCCGRAIAGCHRSDELALTHGISCLSFTPVSEWIQKKNSRLAWLSASSSSNNNNDNFLQQQKEPEEFSTSAELFKIQERIRNQKLLLATGGEGAASGFGRGQIESGWIIMHDAFSREIVVPNNKQNDRQQQEEINNNNDTNNNNIDKSTKTPFQQRLHHGITSKVNKIDSLVTTTGAIRSICFSPEIPDVMFTLTDATDIRVWNIDTSLTSNSSSSSSSSSSAAASSSSSSSSSSSCCKKETNFGTEITRSSRFYGLGNHSKLLLSHTSGLCAIYSYSSVIVLKNPLWNYRFQNRKVLFWIVNLSCCSSSSEEHSGEKKKVCSRMKECLSMFVPLFKTALYLA